MESSRSFLDRFYVCCNKIDGLYYLAARRLGVKENALSPCSQKQLAEELLIPKTTINTIVKEYTDAGYLSLVPSGHSREKNITLTAAGRAYAQKVLRPIYQAEERAISRTLGEYSSEFVKAVEELTQNMTKEFQREIFDRTELK